MVLTEYRRGDFLRPRRGLHRLAVNRFSAAMAGKWAGKEKSGPATVSTAKLAPSYA
jgi:hypothetical protein